MNRTAITKVGQQRGVRRAIRRGHTLILRCLQASQALDARARRATKGPRDGETILLVLTSHFTQRGRDNWEKGVVDSAGTPMQGSPAIVKACCT